MTFIGERDRKTIEKRLQPLVRPVKLVVFSQERECQFCRETRELLQELAGLSDKIQVEVKDFVTDSAEAARLGIDKIPAFAVLGEDGTDYRIRFYGIPAGYEFVSLLESIEMVSKRDSGLTPTTRQALAGLAKPLHLQVFVTPTCPYCPRAVVLAFRFAVESDEIQADMVESTEFPHLANRYGVSGVPHTVIGSADRAMVGAYPEQAALEMILGAAKEM
jgi:glutaredoxin-like protein